MKRIGLFGAGHLGKIHAKCIKESVKVMLVGVYDVNIQEATKVANEFNIPVFSTPESLFEVCDIVAIVTPTSTHFEIAQMAIQRQKHLFIEKPVAATLEEAEELLKLEKNHNVKIQIGHVERFNPAFKTIQTLINNPLFIETHRLGFFNSRGNDVSVVLDLMIHDLDIILKIVKSPLVDIQASGVAIVTDTIDIANARLRFENGCVANLTASRMSLKNMRKMRIFQENAYISIDFYNKKNEIVHIEDENQEDANPFAMILDLGEGKPKKQIIVQNPPIETVNAIQMEVESFADAIEKNTLPEVTLKEGVYALSVAYAILDKINQQTK